MFIKQRLALCSQQETQFLDVNSQEYYLPVLRGFELEIGIYIWVQYTNRHTHTHTYI